MSKLDQFLKEVQNTHYESIIVARLLAITLCMREALEFYSKGCDKYSEAPLPIGFRKEFGCGCCSATVTNKEYAGDDDCDKQVIGLTAREALIKVEAIAMGRNEK